MSNLWTPTHGHASVSQPARTDLHLLCADTGCRQEDLPGVINNRDGWRERVMEICAQIMLYAITLEDQNPSPLLAFLFQVILTKLRQWFCLNCHVICIVCTS